MMSHEPSRHLILLDLPCYLQALFYISFQSLQKIQRKFYQFRNIHLRNLQNWILRGIFSRLCWGGSCF